MGILCDFERSGGGEAWKGSKKYQNIIQGKDFYFAFYECSFEPPIKKGCDLELIELVNVICILIKVY